MRPVPPPLPARLIDGRDEAASVARLRVRTRIAAARLLDAALAVGGAARPVALVSGFWRSGTTWLQESLAEVLVAKTVFEPLSPLEPRRRAALAGRFAGDEDAAQAFIPGPDAATPAFWAALDRAVTARQGSAFTLSCRWGPAESLRRAVVVKDVRMQNLLAAVHGRYGVPVAHLRRHPAAVAASLIRADWHWSFSRIRLAALLPDAMVDATEGADPRAFDDDTPTRIAAYWAWSERRAAARLRGAGWGRVVAYEELAADPAATVSALCAALGLRPRRPARFDRPSASIHPDRFVPRPALADRGGATLTAAEADRIEAVANAVFPGWRDIPRLR